MATKGLKTRSVRPGQPLIIRGISSRGENYSTPEPRRLVNPADHRLPKDFTDSVEDAIQGYGYFNKRPASASASSSSLHDPHQAVDPASVDPIGLSRSMSASNPWTHSGNTTDRSSLFSEYGEFDREASVKVDHMIREIEKILFGEKKLGIIHTQVEYKDWKKFPHLRIVGSRALPIHDTGYEMTASLTQQRVVAENETRTTAAAASSPEPLVVQGKIIKVLHPGETTTAAETYRGSPPSNSQLEEVFEADGCYEEYLAYDHTRAEDEVSTVDARHGSKQRTAGLPPVTPRSCLNEAIVSLVFDAVWADTVRWMEPLARKHYQDAVTSLSPHHLLSLALPSDDDDDDMMVEPVRRHHSESKLSAAAGMVYHPAIRVQPGTAGLGLGELGQLLQIAHIYPTQKGAMVNPKAGLVLSGGAHPSAVPGRLAPHSSRTLSASRRKPGATGHLKPLVENKKALVPSKQMALQGRSIATPSENTALLALPPQSMSLRRALPPIEPSDREPSSSSKQHRGGAGRGRLQQQRIGSAALDEPHRGFPYWDSKLPNHLAQHRPNTTHTIRGSDLPHNSRRSSTPQAPRNVQQQQQQQQQQGGGSNSPKVQPRGLVNGITGTGLGIYGSSTHMVINNPYVH